MVTNVRSASCAESVKAASPEQVNANCVKTMTVLIARRRDHLHCTIDMLKETGAVWRACAPPGNGRGMRHGGCAATLRQAAAGPHG
jgi:hypothetical protein